MKIRNVILITIRSMSKVRWKIYLVCLVCMCSIFLVDQMATNMFRYVYHNMELGNMLQYGQERTLMLRINYTEETEQYVKSINELVDSITHIDGVRAAGSYDETSVYFQELEKNKDYMDVNRVGFKNTFKMEKLGVTDAVYVTPGLEQLCNLELLKGKKDFQNQIKNGVTPVLVGYSYREVAPVGTVLTNKETNKKYQVTGILKKGERWYGDVDAIGSDTVCLNYKMIVCRTQDEIRQSKDIMTTLCTISSSYILLEKDADKTLIKGSIAEKAKELGVSVSAIPMKDVLDEYAQSYEKNLDTSIFMAVIFILFSVISISSATLVSILLEKSEYGIMYAKGLSGRDISLKVLFENGYMMFVSVCIAYLLRTYLILKSRYGAFSILLRRIHFRLTLPFIVFIAFMITVIASILPILILRRMKPVELIGGNE
ncbi:MAG TPA: hypothetical protein DCW90_04610 [Lachnospiraceae bacterium]|nr:ABC transporter permease [uncultured Lachnoclostridium sp.]HAU84791.1 hypothetical protein [Lachnospiraceae bacterium]